MHENRRGPDAIGGWARPGDIRCGECKWKRELARNGLSLGTTVCIGNGPFLTESGSTRFPPIDDRMTCRLAERAVELAGARV